MWFLIFVFKVLLFVFSELGPLDPNWFEVLTAQTSPKERIVADKDDLCANQEGNFKTPSEKTAVDSQLFSTPKVFRHSRVVSPETKDEQSFANAHGSVQLCKPKCILYVFYNTFTCIFYVCLVTYFLYLRIYLKLDLNVSLCCLTERGSLPWTATQSPCLFQVSGQGWVRY